MWSRFRRVFRVSQEQLPARILDLDPRGLRELHWHPTADEWQYVLEGTVSVTMFGSGGRYRTETLEKGDVGYIPARPMGTRSRTSGDKPSAASSSGSTAASTRRSTCHSGSPGARRTSAATNFGKPAALFQKVPTKRRPSISSEGTALKVRASSSEG